MADSSVETGQAQGVVSSNAAENVQLTNNGQGAGGDSGSIVGGASQDAPGGGGQSVEHAAVQQEKQEVPSVKAEGLVAPANGSTTTSAAAVGPSLNSPYQQNSNPHHQQQPQQPFSMDPEQFRKLFIGGLSTNTTDESLSSFYSQFGTLTDCVVMRDGTTKKSRGFGFVSFSSKTEVDAAMTARPHEIDGKVVDAKRAVPRDLSNKSESNMSTKRLYVSGVREDHNEEQLHSYFSSFGKVEKAEIITDKNSGKARGFAFITFDDYDSVDQCVLLKSHMIGSHRCDVKKALSKDDMARAQQMDRDRQERGTRSRGSFGPRGGGMAGGGGGGGGWGGGGGGASYDHSAYDAGYGGGGPGYGGGGYGSGRRGGSGYGGGPRGGGGGNRPAGNWSGGPPQPLGSWSTAPHPSQQPWGAGGNRDHGGYGYGGQGGYGGAGGGAGYGGGGGYGAAEGGAPYAGGYSSANSVPQGSGQWPAATQGGGGNWGQQPPAQPWHQDDAHQQPMGGGWSGAGATANPSQSTASGWGGAPGAAGSQRF